MWKKQPSHSSHSQPAAYTFAYDLNPYDSFMKKHLQHYGYYTGRNDAYNRAMSSVAESEATHGMDVVDSSGSSSDSNNKEDTNGDGKSQEELHRTTQLLYNYESGKMVPTLREPRQLFSHYQMDTTPETRWPSEFQVLNEPVLHIESVPEAPEPFYIPTGMEKTPMSRSHEGLGRVVYHYEPAVGSFFLRSRVGGRRSGCGDVAVERDGPDDVTLQFESRFESGNLHKAVQTSDFDYELWLRHDLYTTKHTQWYYFRVANTRSDVTYRFTIVNLMKPDSLYNDGMRPVMYSDRQARETGVGWVRAGSDIKYYRNNIRFCVGKAEKWYYSLTWTCRLPHDNDTVYFAHCYPYLYSDLQNYVSEVTKDSTKAQFCKHRVLCRSLAGNLIYLLTITSPARSPEELKRRRGVVITSRVHPGESNASWMMKGFLDFLTGSSPDAKLLRDTFVFKVIPMLNPDGVIVGNYRCSLSGRDLNRNYKTVLKDHFPPIWHTKALIRKFVEEREVIAYCDLHGHSRRHNVFIYGCENRGNASRRLRERVFPLMLNKNCPDKFCFESCKFKIQKSKEGTGRIVMWNMGIMNSYTMEATFCGSSLGNRQGFHFSTADFESMGYHFCDTLLDYCDPDSSKCTKTLLELEERVRADILKHLRQREGQEPPCDLADINLDQDFSSDVESSDGGSDSSESDGLPVNLQYVAGKVPAKKKRLKSRKERDKSKCSPSKEETKKSTTSAGGKKETTAPKSKKHQSVRQQKDEKSTDTVINKDKPNEGYLDALTKAYMQNGVLSDRNKDVPHFRYSAGSCHMTNVTFDGMCAQHEKAFAAQHVAEELLQYRHPDAETSRRNESDDLGRESRPTGSGNLLLPSLPHEVTQPRKPGAGTHVLKYSKRPGSQNLSGNRFLHVFNPHQALVSGPTAQDALADGIRSLSQGRISSNLFDSNKPYVPDRRQPQPQHHLAEMSVAQQRQREFHEAMANNHDFTRKQTGSADSANYDAIKRAVSSAHSLARASAASSRTRSAQAGVPLGLVRQDSVSLTPQLRLGSAWEGSSSELRGQGQGQGHGPDARPRQGNRGSPSNRHGASGVAAEKDARVTLRTNVPLSTEELQYIQIHNGGLVRPGADELMDRKDPAVDSVAEDMYVIPGGSDIVFNQGGATGQGRGRELAARPPIRSTRRETALQECLTAKGSAHSNNTTQGSNPVASATDGAMATATMTPPSRRGSRSNMAVDAVADLTRRNPEHSGLRNGQPNALTTIGLHHLARGLEESDPDGAEAAPATHNRGPGTSLALSQQLSSSGTHLDAKVMVDTYLGITREPHLESFDLDRSKAADHGVKARSRTAKVGATPAKVSLMISQGHQERQPPAADSAPPRQARSGTRVSGPTKQ